MTDKRTVLVTGATGQQGGAVASALISNGHKVRALTRKPDSTAARRLAATGAEIIAGDLANADSVVKAARGSDAMYLMGNFFETGPAGETEQGTNAADAAKAAGVGHLIYSSVADADQATGIPHFESKFAVEKHIAGLGIPYTISAPVAFMENATASWSLGALQQGTLAFGLPPERALELIGIRDIGAFVAALVERRESVFGRRFDIAGDKVTGADQAAILTRATGRPIRYAEIPLSVAREQNAEAAIMFEWLDRTGYDVDIAKLHGMFPEVGWHSFADWAASIDWSVLGGEK